MANNILRLPAVKSKCGLSRSTIYQRVAQGDFPAPVPLGGRAVGWIEEEIEGWLSKQIERRGSDAQPAAPRKEARR